MTRFVVNTPVTTDQPLVMVDAGLQPGRHRFQLVVVDDHGNKSAPATITVIIQQRRPPVG